MAKKKAPEQWQNRIVGYGEESPEQLLANPSNFRVHPKGQQEALLGALEEVGIVQDVLVNKDTGFLVDGHLRVALAMRTGQATIPVKYVSLSESEEKLILATLDPITHLATTDAQKLDELLHEVSTGSAAIQQMLDDMAVQAHLYVGNILRYGEGDRGPTPGERYESFKNATIRQIVLSYPLGGEYERTIKLLAAVCDSEGLETNTDAVTWLLNEYEARTCEP